jgi:hypothetical protein
MKKSRVIAFALGTTLLSLGLFFGTAAVAPEEACAGDCQFDWWDVDEWGDGSTCTAAENNCYSDAYSAASAVCAAENKGLCQVGNFTHNTCYWGGGKWNVDCNLEYKCDGGPDIPF